MEVGIATSMTESEDLNSSRGDLGLSSTGEKAGHEEKACSLLFQRGDLRPADQLFSPEKTSRGKQRKVEGRKTKGNEGRSRLPQRETRLGRPKDLITRDSSLKEATSNCLFINGTEGGVKPGTKVLNVKT